MVKTTNVGNFGEKVFNISNYTILTLLSLACIFPFFYVISVSLTSTTEFMRNAGFLIIPRDITFEAYQHLLLDNQIPRAFVISVTVTVVGTANSLFNTILMAYPLSHKRLIGRNAILLGVVFTMLFNGGMIPTYLLIKKLGLIDTLGALIIPSTISAFNLILVKTFFENLPEEMKESAKIDGCSDWGVLCRVVLPLSKPIIATIGLFYAVFYWNMYVPALLYINNEALLPLQVVLQNLLEGVSETEQQMRVITEVPTEAFKMAAIIISVLPMLCIYPWLQKYFVKGALLGSIKG